MKHPNPSISIILALTILFAAMLSCNIGQTEKRTILFDQYYIIEPSTLMASLKNDDMNAFSPVSDRPGLLPVEQQIPVNWLQADYFYITNTLYESVLGKSLQGWQLNSMDFDLGCSKIGYGFQNGRFEFFKVVKDKEQESRISRFIDIDPRGNFVHVIEEEFYPNLVNLEVIDLAHLKVSADLALQMTEKNSGAEKRQSIENACDISLILSPSPASDKQRWAVTYSKDDDRTSLFYVQIDPYTGEIHFP